MTFKNKKGFTLVELLIVIAIVGLISAAAMYALNNSRLKSRDAKRKGDISALDKAISMYINENGSAPANTAPDPNKGECLSNTAGPGMALKTFMTTIPVDPRYPITPPTAYTAGTPTAAPDGMCYYYWKGTGTSYKLSYIIEGNSSINTISR